MSLPVALSPSQISDFLSRNPAVNTKVVEFQTLNLFGTYEQQQSQDDFLTWLQSFYITSPIPPYGIMVADIVLGNVSIFPDAHGNLRFTQVPEDYNSGSDTFPGGGTGLPTLGNITSLLAGLAVAWIGITAWSHKRS